MGRSVRHRAQAANEDVRMAQHPVTLLGRDNVIAGSTRNPRSP
jgi:hypothetical protein